MKKKSPPRVHAYSIPCPQCATDHRVVTTSEKFITFPCVGCSRVVVVRNDLLLSIRPEDMAVLEHMFDMKVCGKVDDYSMAHRYFYKPIVSDRHIDRLKEILSSDDPIKEMGSL